MYDYVSSLKRWWDDELMSRPLPWLLAWAIQIFQILGIQICFSCYRWICVRWIYGKILSRIVEQNISMAFLPQAGPPWPAFSSNTLKYFKLNVVRRIVSTNGFALTIPAKFVVNGIHQEWNRRIWTFLWSFCFPRLMGKLSNCQGRVEGGAAGKVHFSQFWTGVSSARLWESGLVGFIGNCSLEARWILDPSSKSHRP